MTKLTCWIPLFLAMALIGWAEPQRTALVTENQMPNKGQLELGYHFDGRSFDNMDLYTHAVQARFGLLKDLTVRARVPAVSREPDIGDSEFGLGDVSLGFDLVAYQDVFTFPFIMPHVDVFFATGDDAKGLGTGDTELKAGISIGTKTHEQFWWVVDLSYWTGTLMVNDDVYDAAFSILWELSDQFTLSVEGLVRHMEATDSDAVLLGGGMSYKWTPDFVASFFIGKWNENDTGEDVVAKASLAYQF